MYYLIVSTVTGPNNPDECGTLISSLFSENCADFWQEIKMNTTAKKEKKVLITM
jgi:hypothetical protein